MSPLLSKLKKLYPNRIKPYTAEHLLIIIKLPYDGINQQVQRVRFHLLNQKVPLAFLFYHVMLYLSTKKRHPPNKISADAVIKILKQIDIVLGADAVGLGIPEGGLHLTDVSLA